jgi:hypothetical protein
VVAKKPEWKMPLGRHRYRWDDNIKMDHGKHDVRALFYLKLHIINIS